jgi:hypothetical protein
VRQRPKAQKAPPRGPLLTAREILEAAKPKPKRRKRTYTRRDMRAED